MYMYLKLPKNLIEKILNFNEDLPYVCEHKNSKKRKCKKCLTELCDKCTWKLCWCYFE